MRPSVRMSVFICPFEAAYKKANLASQFAISPVKRRRDAKSAQFQIRNLFVGATGIPAPARPSQLYDGGLATT